MTTRRNFLATCATALLGLSANHAFAAPPMVEIVAMPHPPVKMALAQLREWLAAQGNKLSVREIDSESPEGMKRMQAVGLSGHIPVLILIDGQHRHKRKDGTPVDFVNFPNVPDTPAGARGNWTTADVQAVLAARMK